MRRITFLAALFLFNVLVAAPDLAVAQDNMQDSVDVLHYDLHLDIGNKTYKRIEGSAEVTMHVLSRVDSLVLELCPSDIDSVWLNGTSSSFSYNASVRLLSVPFSGNVGDTAVVKVFYRKGPYVASQSWGGFYFEDNIYYNLGIAIYEYPHNVGKAWFPCRDNFYDKATYHFEITAQPDWKAICTGLLDTVVQHADGSSTWCWTLGRQTPTYLVGVAVAPFNVIERQYESTDATYPAIIGFLDHDSVNVWRAFDKMSKVIPMYETCFGPYRWDRVGYVSTPRGSMEHSSSISFTTYCMDSQQEACFATMAHEFAHSWFGNLVTCATSEDMWINEGGASFCEEVAVQALNAETRPLHYKEYARANLKKVLLKAHLDDQGFKPVYGQTPQFTYGTTVYSKGATVWHSLRGYMGEDLFYSSLRTLFNRHAFKNIDSWQLRDSLSLYSGIDLTDFFDFHVFNAGFVDYVIDSITMARSSAAVYIRQKSYGTNAIANGNKVWISFFSSDLQRVNRLVSFDGESARVVVQLPFTPAFAVVDFDEELSKASIGQYTVVSSQGVKELNDVFFKADVPNDGTWAWLYVTHHWSRPDTSLSPQVLRMADRYWSVTGVLPENDEIQGQFYFSRSGDTRSLDNEFITLSSQMQSARLLYREGAGDQWRVIPSVYQGSSVSGYFITPELKKGEYTLALIDTNYVDIQQPVMSDNKNVTVYPNPSTGNVTVMTDVDGEKLSVDICDNSGKKISSNLTLISGQQTHLSLSTGNYIFVIRRLESGETVSVKVQIMNF